MALQHHTILTHKMETAAERPVRPCDDSGPSRKLVSAVESRLLRHVGKKRLGWLDDKLYDIDFDIGDYITHNGHKTAGLYFLESATAHVLSDEGLPIFIKTSGDTIGEVSFLDKSERSTDVVVVTQVSARLLNFELFEKLIREDLELAFVILANLNCILSENLRRTHRSLNELRKEDSTSLQAPDQRL